MTALAVTAAVTRTELGLADLSLQQAGVYALVDYQPGRLTKRRTRATSPTIAGGVQTSSVADIRTVRLTLRVFGSSKAIFDVRAQALFDAFDQSSYVLTVGLAGGTAVAWVCDDAEYDLTATSVDKYGLATAVLLRQAWTFDIPVQPYPTSGVL